MANGETGTRVTPGTGHLSRVTCHVRRCDDYYVTSPSAEAGTLSRYSPHTAAERMPGPVRQVVTYIERPLPMVSTLVPWSQAVVTIGPVSRHLHPGHYSFRSFYWYTFTHSDSDMVQCPSSSTLSWICLLFILSPQDSIYSSVSHIAFIRNF